MNPILFNPWLKSILFRTDGYMEYAPEFLGGPTIVLPIPENLLDTLKAIEQDESTVNTQQRLFQKESQVLRCKAHLARAEAELADHKDSTK